jgi:hypothetical protein
MNTSTALHAEGTKNRLAKTLVRGLPATGRVLMGFIFFVTGLNGFLNFLPQPSTPMPEGATAFASALMKTGYLFQLISATQLIVGALLLSNRFVPLALTLIAPIVVNILAFHLFLAPSGIGLAVIILVLELYLAWIYRRAFRSMLTVRTSPNSE